MADKTQVTIKFKVPGDEKENMRQILRTVFDALNEKGYNPINQIVGYLLTEDPTYAALPKYPTVSRDLAIVCDESVTVAQAEDVITAAAGKLLRNIRLFDIYRGTGIAEGKKSLAFAMELRADDRTLTDADSEQVMTKVLTALKEKLDAVLR